MKIIIAFIAILLCNNLLAQVNIDNIQIARDKWGVPHIFAKTDIEAVYGLAWAHSEDDFAQIQHPFLATRGLLGAVKGKKGAMLDLISFLIDAEKIVDEKYDTTFSPQFKKMLKAYATAINKYAATHPEEVLHKKLFPITEKDVIKSYVLVMTLISNVHSSLHRIMTNNLIHIPGDKTNLLAGSNAFAFSPNKTKDGKTYLVSNSHQPLNSYMSWYEVHINTEEGWNFLGATFCGGVTPFIGTNENLGWSHCVNYNDFVDIYKLKMHPKQKLKYKLDGKWLKLKKRIFKTKVKIGNFQIVFRKKIYQSKHGFVIKNKTGYYAFRFPANMVIGGAEQWYKMNKAKNKEEFETALSMQELSSLSITYADKKGNISFIDNGLFPHRASCYDWYNILEGDTSATLWPAKFVPIDSLLSVKNPKSGYLYHVNGSGFYCTDPKENPNPSDYLPSYLREKFTRNKRIEQIMPNYDKVSYKDIKTIKYDQKVLFPLYNFNLKNFNWIRTISPKDYPELTDVITVLQKWNGNVDIANKQAAVYSLVYQYLNTYMKSKGILDIPGYLPTKEYLNALRFAKNHLLKHFGTLEIELGELQKHVRGNKVAPVGGVPEALTAMYFKPYQKKYSQSRAGESYILFATYDENGVQLIETINCYGASNKPESKHYDDQMDMFLNQELKTMTLDKNIVLGSAERIYNPK